MVSVLLDDVRVSTSLRFGDGTPALGTRASAPVRRQVLEGGHTWTGRARALDDWLISAYQPLHDGAGRRVGMLSVGFAEQPFSAAFRRALVVSLALTALGVALALALALRGGGAVFAPIGAFTGVARAIAAGEDRRVGDLGTRDEIGELAREFDYMLDLLAERRAAVAAAAARLESEVDARTIELRDKNARLEAAIDLLNRARTRLVAAEKLAALGQLTAGVAHEINNPIAVIQGNLEVMRSQLGTGAAAVDTEITLVFEQVDRIHRILERLLEYARTSSWHSEARAVDVAAVAADACTLVAGVAAEHRVRLELGDPRAATVEIDPEDLTRVLVNLLTNAIQASPAGAAVRVDTALDADGSARIGVTDHGAGIAADDLGRIFDPFFSTKGARGTGLGLAICEGIVQRYGGNIAVRSSVGEGSRFEVTLPTN